MGKGVQFKFTLQILFTFFIRSPTELSYFSTWLLCHCVIYQFSIFTNYRYLYSANNLHSSLHIVYSCQSLQSRGVPSPHHNSKLEMQQKHLKITLQGLQRFTAEMRASVHRTTLNCNLHRAGLYGRIARKGQYLKKIRIHKLKLIPTCGRLPKQMEEGSLLRWDNWTFCRLWETLCGTTQQFPSPSKHCVNDGSIMPWRCFSSARTEKRWLALNIGQFCLRFETKIVPAGQWGSKHTAEATRGWFKVPWNGLLKIPEQLRICGMIWGLLYMDTTHLSWRSWSSFTLQNEQTFQWLDVPQEIHLNLSW